MIKNKKGVSLIEMLIVVALLGILANITYIYCTCLIKRAESVVSEHNSRVELIEQMASEIDPSNSTDEYIVYMYTEPYFQGTAIRLYEGNNPTKKFKNIKSIRLEGNVKLILKHDSSGKRDRVITSSNNNLNIDGVNFIEVVLE